MENKAEETASPKQNITCYIEFRIKNLALRIIFAAANKNILLKPKKSIRNVSRDL